MGVSKIFEKSAAGHHSCPRLDGAEGAGGDTSEHLSNQRVVLCKDWRKHPTKKGSFQEILGTHKELARFDVFFLFWGEWVCKDSLLEMRHFASDTKSPERRQSSQNFRCVIS